MILRLRVLVNIFIVSVFYIMNTMTAIASINTEMEATEELTLFNKILKMDTAAFDAFNHCSNPEQLAIHESYFTKNVEFYHDTGGVTWNRDDMIANTRKYVCGHYNRVLIDGTLSVYPIKDFGAIEKGTHKFCQLETGACEGYADFIIIWHKQDEKWLITRVLSFGHRVVE